MKVRPPAEGDAVEFDTLSEPKASPERKTRARKSPSAFRTISEVANELKVPQHVLRFWEGKFTQIRPLKRGGGRRYYRPDDIALLRQISTLLYVQGYTIKGVQRLLREGGGQLGDDIPPPTPEEKAGAARAEAERYDLLDLDEPQLPMPGLTPRLLPPAPARKSTPARATTKAPSPARARRSAKDAAAESLAESMGLELVRLQRVLRETLNELEALRAALR